MKLTHIKLKNKDGEDVWMLKRSIRDDKGEIITLGWYDWPAKYRSIALSKNVDEAQEVFEADVAKAKRLEKAGYIKDGTIDIIAYLQDNPKDTQTLKDLGISNTVILQAQEQLKPPKVWMNVRTSEKITSEEYQALGNKLEKP